MKILITGGAGLVGSHAAEFYAKRGDEVIVIDNLMRSKLFGYNKKSVEYNWNYLSSFRNIRKIKGDVREEKDVKKALAGGVDAVIHAAGQPGVPLSVRIPKEDFSINALGTLNVLECVRQTCPKAAFVYCSTNKVFGENVDKIPLKENTTRYEFENIEGIGPELSVDHTGHTPYGASKYVGDLYAQEYAHIYGMKTAVFRMSCIYGTRQFGFEDQGWVSWFIIAVLTGRPIKIFGNGKQVRDVLYVDDVIEAYDAFINSDIKHAVWTIGGGIQNTTSLIEFLDIIKTKLSLNPDISFSGWRPSDQKVYISDLSRIQKELAWRPKTSFQQGVDKLIPWVKEHLDIFRD